MISEMSGPNISVYPDTNQVGLFDAGQRAQRRFGALFNVARIFHEQGVNIIEVYHQRVFTTLPAKGLITDIECETRDRNHLDRLLTALRRAQYEVSQVELQ